MDKNNKKILLVLALMFFVLTINRFLPGEEDVDTQNADISDRFAAEDKIDELVLTREDLEMAEELSEYLDDEGIPQIYTLDVECIMQLPELPTGCEVTSLAIVLRYLGFDVDKTELSDNFLKKEPVGKGTQYDNFWGNPRSESGYGCYAPVIVECANDYLGSEGEDRLLAFDLSGSEFEDLFADIYAGNPVIVWSTVDLKEPVVNFSKSNGSRMEWIVPAHCVVMYGYNLKNGIVEIADPLSGKRICSANLFKDRFIKMYQQAVVIRHIEER